MYGLFGNFKYFKSTIWSAHVVTSDNENRSCPIQLDCKTQYASYLIAPNTVSYEMTKNN